MKRSERPANMHGSLLECLSEGPDKLRCANDKGHENMHYAAKLDGTGIRYWSLDWKPNPSRTTWRS